MSRDIVKKIAVFLSGALGLCAQVFVLRILVAALGVNELFMGAMLGVWVLAEGLGVIVADWIWIRLEEKSYFSAGDFFAGLVALSGIFFVGAVWVAPVARVFFGWELGVFVGFGRVLLAMLVFGGPVAFFHGAAFVGACVVLGDASGRSAGAGGSRCGAAASGGTAYVWETAGTLAGGVLVAALLLWAPSDGVPPSRLTAAAALIALAASLFAIPLARRTPFLRRTLLLAAAAAPALLLVASHLRPAPHFPLPPQSNHIKTAITPYSTLTLTKISQNAPSYSTNLFASIETQTQYTIYTDGKPILTMPYGDLEFSEELVRYTTLLLTRPPDYMALVGYSARSILEKAYQDTTLKKIDLIEPDIALINMIKEVPLPTNKDAISHSHPQISYIKSDPLRFFKNHTPSHKYDIIILNSPLPISLLENRLYTKEFFRTLYNALSDEKESILSFHITGSDTYITPEIAQLNASIISSASEVFKKQIYVLPATGGFTQTNIYFCIKNSASSVPSDISEEKILPPPPDINRITQNLKHLPITSPVVSPSYLAARFSPINRRTYEDSLKDISRAARPNTLLKPIACYYATLFESRQYAPQLFSFLKISSHILAPSRSIYFSLFLFLIAGLFFIIKKPPHLPLHFISVNMFSVGFSSMIFTLLIMFIFQSVHGYIYGYIGLLTASFMFGSTVGASLATNWLTCASHSAPRFQNYLSVSHFLLGVLNLIVALLLLLFFQPTLSPLYFLLLLILGGFLSGFPYPISLKFLENLYSGGKNMSRSKLYVAELMGGFLGGATAGIILLPLIGAPLSFLLISSIEILVASLLRCAFIPNRV